MESIEETTQAAFGRLRERASDLAVEDALSRTLDDEGADEAQLSALPARSALPTARYRSPRVVLGVAAALLAVLGISSGLWWSRGDDQRVTTPAVPQSVVSSPPTSGGPCAAMTQLLTVNARPDRSGTLIDAAAVANMVNSPDFERTPDGEALLRDGVPARYMARVSGSGSADQIEVTVVGRHLEVVRNWISTVAPTLETMIDFPSATAGSAAPSPFSSVQQPMEINCSLVPTTTAVSPAAPPQYQSSLITGSLPSIPADPAASDPAVGQPIPRVSGKDFSGVPADLVTPGVPTMILSVASWSSHVQSEVPAVIAWMRQGGAKGVDVVMVVTGSDPNSPPRLASSWFAGLGWTGRVLVDDEAGSIAQALGLTGYPDHVFVDSAGKVTARIGGAQTSTQLAVFIASIAPHG